MRKYFSWRIKAIVGKLLSLTNADGEALGSQRSAAKVAASLPHSLAFLAYANFGVRAPLLATDDPAETVRIIADFRSHMKKTPQLLKSARLPIVAGAGLEPATPAL